MPRPLRFSPPDSVLHAINRGNDRRCLFESVADYEDFLELVAWAKQQSPMRILAYCLMPNHWHLILWPETADAVSLFLHRLCTTHSVKRRRETGTVGLGSYLPRPLPWLRDPIRNLLLESDSLRRIQSASSRPRANSRGVALVEPS